MTALSRIIIIAILFSGTLKANSLEKLSPQKYQPEIAYLVSSYLSFYHYSKMKIDDRASRNLLEEYLASLDPNKLFFTQNDIAEFRRYETRLDDHLKAEPVNLTVPFLIFNRYKERVHERVTVIHKLLKGSFDFTLDEHYTYDREKVEWPATKAELDDLWRRRLKEDMVRFKLRDKPEEEYLEILEKRYTRLRKSIDEYEPVDVLERYLASLSEAFDPHSSYLKPATKDNFDIQMGHALEGIGATLTRDGEYTKVVEVIKGGPADKTGELSFNDKIIAVAQGDEVPDDVVDLRLDKVVKKIRGPKGTVVRLTIIPAAAKDQSETREVVIVRDKVEITQADAKYEIMKVEDESRAYRIGVIDIPSFYMDSIGKANNDPDYKSTTKDVRKLLSELERKNVDGIVIDLRQNGGGSLDEAIRLTGLFISDGPVVQIKDHRGKIRIEEDPDPKLVYRGPLLVLTSVFSASASEIFASAIQDYDRGVVVGSKSTHGKGTVQNVLSLQGALGRLVRKNFDDDMAGALKITTHKFYRVSGGSTQFKGVSPDIVLPSPYDGLDVTEESLEYALPWDEIKPADFKPYNKVRDTLPYLSSNSAKRILENPEFRYVKDDLQYRAELKRKNVVSLNFEKRLAEKKTLDALVKMRDEERALRKPIAIVIERSDKEEEKQKTEDDDATTPVPDFILDEALLVLRDYVAYTGNRIAESSHKKDSL